MSERRGNPLPPHLIKQLRRLRREGKSFREIVRITGVAKSTIEHYVHSDPDYRASVETVQDHTDIPKGDSWADQTDNRVDQGIDGIKPEDALPWETAGPDGIVSDPLDAEAESWPEQVPGEYQFDDPSET